MSRSAKAPSALSALAGVLLATGFIVSILVVSTQWTVSADESQHRYYFRNVVIGGGGGFVPGIVFNTKQPNIIYARTDIGGAYRWDQDDNRWIPLLDWIGADDWNLTGVESIASDPIDPDRVYLAVGTYTNEFTPQNGAILRSSDRGRNWRRFNLPFKVGGNMPGRSMGERLAIDPNKHSILYLGARSGNGLWRSTDHGETWSKVTSFPNPGTYFQDPSSSYTRDLVGVVWVTFDPTSSKTGKATQTIYVGVADLNNSVYRSTDGGATWALVPGQPTGF
jgi:xyloglucan-specific exo-beta-1,4-glucanase